MSNALIKKSIEVAASTSSTPIVLLLEVGHIQLPLTDDGYQWAKSNIEMADSLIGSIIRNYGKHIRVVLTLIINDLEEKTSPNEHIHKITKKCRHISPRNINLFYERNLRNRAFSKIKKHFDPLRLVYNNNRVFFKGDDEICSVPIANSTSGDVFRIIPRCGLIMYCYFEKAMKMASQRLCAQNKPKIIFISFSRHQHETESVRLGYTLFQETSQTDNITAILATWKDERYSTIYNKSSVSKTWNISFEKPTNRTTSAENEDPKKWCAKGLFKAG